MAKSDPQSQRKRTWGEFLFGGEEGAAAKAQYKREMGINPANKAKQNVEASISAKAMENPTSKPARTRASTGRLPPKTAPSSPTPEEIAKRKKDTEEWYKKGAPDKPLRGTAGTYTKSYDVKPKENKFERSVNNNPVQRADSLHRFGPRIIRETGELSKKKNKNVKVEPLGGGSLQSDSAKNQQGMKVKGSPTYAESANKKKAVSNASDKSRLAGKMTNFESMKARQYEKEGFGGRSMTSAGAKARVQKERSYKNPIGGLASMAKAKMASKVAPKAATKPVKASGTKQGSTSTFASKMQGRNVPGSPTYSGAKTKSGFKFSDIFNRKK